MEDNLTVLDIFTTQAHRYPEQKLICFNDHWVTYADIDQVSSAICGQLIKCGVTKGDTVGIYLTRCLEMPAIILGILKSGAICVPFDPAYPVAQLKLMQEKTQVQLLLTSQALFDQAKEVGVNTLVLDIHHPATAQVKLNPEDGAYVLFTSGTTGAANAVLKTHKALVKPLLVWLNKQNGHISESRMLLRAPFTHSPFLWELFFPLVSGVELIIASKESLSDMGMLAQLIKHYQVTHLDVSPAHLQAFIEMSELAKLSSLVEVGCSGEVLPLQLIKEFTRQSSAVLVSTYGCTEFPSATSHIYTATDAALNYIGLTNLGVSLYLLDADMLPVPDGEVGEIYLTGEQLASGYLNDVEETKKRFIRLKLDGSPSKVFFKTGDVGRRLLTGAYEFIGRVDRQLQVHGFRVEPQEIEALLNNHDNVQDSLVLAYPLQNQNTSLVAYIVLNDIESVDLYDLRNFLLKVLPRHKVPAIFIPLSEFPRNQHHKIDYKNLISPQVFLDGRKVDKYDEMNATERQLVEIWSELLNISTVCVDDDFFLVGGNSLLATVMCTKIEAKFNKTIPIELIFQFPTVRLLAKSLDEYGNSVNNRFYSIITPIQTEGSQPPFFWLYGGSVVPMIREKIGNNQPLYLLNHQSLDGKKAKYLSTSEMAGYYIQAIMQVDSKGPYNLGGYSIGGMIIYEIAQQLSAQGKEVTLLFLLDPVGGYIKKIKKNSTIKGNMCLSLEYNEFKKLGYITYFLSKIEGIKISAYLKSGKPLPTELIWPYQLSFYRKASACYQPKHPFKGIEKIILIQCKYANPEIWENIVQNKADIYTTHSSHHQLLEKNYCSEWINILVDAMADI